MIKQQKIVRSVSVLAVILVMDPKMPIPQGSF